VTSEKEFNVAVEANEAERSYATLRVEH